MHPEALQHTIITTWLQQHGEDMLTYMQSGLPGCRARLLLPTCQAAGSTCMLYGETQVPISLQHPPGLQGLRLLQGLHGFW
jgi:hypothetical protein